MAGHSPPTGAAVLRAELTSAIQAASLLELAEHGFARMSMEAVARRAGVGKAAVYRRWPSKLALVSDVIGQALVPPVIGPAGRDLREDVRAMLASFADLLARPGLAAVIADLASEALRVPELNACITRAVGVPTRQQAGDALDRAVSRGELRPDVNRDVALDLTLSPLYWRAVVRRRSFDDTDLDRFTDAIVGGLTSL